MADRRRGDERPGGFAAVDVLAPSEGVSLTRGMTVRVRSQSGVEAELVGVDRSTALRLVRLIVQAGDPDVAVPGPRT